MRPVRNEKDYEAALKKIDVLMDMEETQDVLDELEVLSILVEKYEDSAFPIEVPDPVEAIRFRIEQLGLSTVDVAKSLGGANRASEIMNRKRTLSIRMIKNLHRDFNIPYESLIGA